jgi:hypothetical protein
LPEVVLETKERVEFGTEGGRAGLEESVRGEQVTFAASFVVAYTLSERDDFARDVYSLRTRARCPEHVVAGEQAGGKRRGVVEVASDRDGMFAERSSACSVLGHGVVQLSGQTCGDLRFDRGRAARYGASGFLEEGDDLVARHREPGPETLQSERYCRKAFGVVETNSVRVSVA